MAQPLPIDINEVVKSTVVAVTWLYGKGRSELAEAMRDEFMAEWGFDAEHWNDACDELIDYAERKGEGIDPAYWLREARIELPGATS